MTDLHADGVRLTPATIDRLNTEDISGDALAILLGVAAPASWPPPFNGPETREWMRRSLLANARHAGWLGWYIIATLDGVPTLAGTAGYKGQPDKQGEVEIGYGVVPAYHRRGIASASVRLLCGRAFAAGVIAVLAETLSDGIASQGVLGKAGFTKTGTRLDPDDGEVWRYRLDR
jgi:ribosomal-protein-alanine N-acetyltransferase